MKIKLGRIEIGRHMQCNRFPHVIWRYWRPRGLLIPSSIKAAGGQIYKWFWLYIFVGNKEGPQNDAMDV